MAFIQLAQEALYQDTMLRRHKDSSVIPSESDDILFKSELLKLICT